VESKQPDFNLNYGGQAVIEGVMMRGRRAVAVAVRNPQGQIVLHSELLRSAIYTSRWAKLPFVRGLVLLWDTLVLGLRMLMWSANVAMAIDPPATDAVARQTPTTPAQPPALAGPMMWATLVVSLTFGVGLFFIAPAALAGLAEPYLASAFLTNLLEGLIRLAFFIGYLALMGLLPDLRRVFAYHGAEHMTIHAYEAGQPLDVATISRHGTAHVRCGTSFLLIVVVLSILLFAVLGPLDLMPRLASRLVLIPLLVGVAYELLKWSARHYAHPLVRAFIAPNLALQRLTTRPPDDSMIQVAVAALQRLLEDEGTLKTSDNRHQTTD